MNNFRTEIEIEKSASPIQYDSNLLFIGSCFANNMGDYFKSNSFNTLVNPFGVLYNPISIANSLKRLLVNKYFNEDEILYQNGLYHTFFHHSQFNQSAKKEYLQNINQHFAHAIEFLNNTDYCIITFGTSWVYKHRDSQQIVSNCHKYPTADFERYKLSTTNIIDEYLALIEALRKNNPNLKIVFTVSPVRHWKDGAHGNQISKAILLLAIEEICAAAEGTSYFPAYELLIDDLRDYRFFDDDMLHPSNKAIEYIRNKFTEAWFDASACQLIQLIEKLKKSSEHRPFNLKSEMHQSFVKKQIHKVDELQKQYKGIDFTELLQTFKNQLL